MPDTNSLHFVGLFGFIFLPATKYYLQINITFVINLRQDIILEKHLQPNEEIHFDIQFNCYL